MNNNIRVKIDNINDYIYINIDNHCLKLKIPSNIHKKHLKDQNHYDSYLTKFIMVEILKYKRNNNYLKKFL